MRDVCVCSEEAHQNTKRDMNLKQNLNSNRNKPQGSKAMGEVYKNAEGQRITPCQAMPTIKMRPDARELILGRNQLGAFPGR